jgi:two-component system, NarL family, response regulator NreC
VGVSTIVLSIHADKSFVLRALKAGPRAYVLKESAEGDLINAVRMVSEGKSFFSPVVSRMLVEDYVRQLQDKLNLHSVPELILYAVRKGVIG